MKGQKAFKIVPMGDDANQQKDPLHKTALSTAGLTAQMKP